jgi:hypothetical protein
VLKCCKSFFRGERSREKAAEISELRTVFVGGGGKTTYNAVCVYQQTSNVYAGAFSGKRLDKRALLENLRTAKLRSAKRNEDDEISQVIRAGLSEAPTNLSLLDMSAIPSRAGSAPRKRPIGGAEGRSFSSRRSRSRRGGGSPHTHREVPASVLAEARAAGERERAALAQRLRVLAVQAQSRSVVVASSSPPPRQRPTGGGEAPQTAGPLPHTHAHAHAHAHARVHAHRQVDTSLDASVLLLEQASLALSAGDFRPHSPHAVQAQLHRPVEGKTADVPVDGRKGGKVEGFKPKAPRSISRKSSPHSNPAPH